MNRHRSEYNRGVSRGARIPPNRSSISANDVLVRDVQKMMGRGSSISFPTRPIQHPIIGDRIQIEQLQNMSQLTANSLGSADISYAGPPGHQNSSQSQSSFSASCKGSGAPMSRLTMKPVPSVAQTLNPAKALLHLRKCRRVPSPFPGSHASFASIDKHQRSPLLHFPQDARSTWGTQGSLQSNASSLSLDRNGIMRELREELKSLFATKHEELTGGLRLRQDELSAVVEARLRETDLVKAEELRTLRMTIDNVSEEVKFQVDGLERKLDKMSSDLDTHKDANLISSRHLEEQSQRLKTEFQNLAATAQDELKQHLVDAKQELTREGRDLVQLEGRRQLDVIKEFAKSWMTDMTKLAESAASSVVQKCQVPFQMVESLFHASQRRTSSDSESKSCMQQSRAITPPPNRNQRKKRHSHRNEPQYCKRHKKSLLSQCSTIEKPVYPEAKSIKRPHRRVRAMGEIAPLELRLSQRSNPTSTPCRRTRSMKAAPNINDFSPETVSSVSETQSDHHSPAPARTHWSGANGNKEDKTPASLKIKPCSLVTPMGTIEKNLPASGLSPRSSAGHGTPQMASRSNSNTQPNADGYQKSSTDKNVRKRVQKESISKSKSLTYSQESIALSFPINEVLTENLAECSSPLSESSMLHLKRTRTRVEPTEKKTTKRKCSGVSPKRLDNGAVRLRRRAKKTYSKRQECTFPADDHLTFSFHSEQ